MSYPDGFSGWPLDRRNEYFAAAARDYRDNKRVNGYGGDGATGATATPKVAFVSAASLADRALPDRHFLVPGMIPGRNVTLLSGNGGDGKSLLSLMLLTSVSAGALWLGMQVAQGAAIYVSCEDEIDEVHRRLVSICAAEGHDLADLDRLEIFPLAGMNAVMAEEGKAGSIATTPLWVEFAKKVEEVRPALVVFDNAADIFAGNEIARTQVRQFIGLLRSLAFKADCAILLLSHPSVAGMTNGSGISGSTHWHNSVRSRLYLIRPDPGEDGFVDPDVRILQGKKNNYGPMLSEVRMRWSEGRFVALDAAPVSGFSRLAAEAKAERVFLDLLGKLTAQGRDVSPKPSQSHAPTVFAKHPQADGVNKREFSLAMERLLGDGRIAVEAVGPASRRYSKLVVSEPMRSGE